MDDPPLFVYSYSTKCKFVSVYTGSGFRYVIVDPSVSGHISLNRRPRASWTGSRVFKMGVLVLDPRKGSAIYVRSVACAL